MHRAKSHFKDTLAMWLLKSVPHQSSRRESWIHITSSSSMLVWHFSRLILLIATFSFLGEQYAAWTTAVAPLPAEQNKKQFVTKPENSSHPFLHSEKHKCITYTQNKTYPLKQCIHIWLYGEDEGACMVSMGNIAVSPFASAYAWPKSDVLCIQSIKREINNRCGQSPWHLERIHIIFSDTDSFPYSRC